jgi:hypothetical protein
MRRALGAVGWMVVFGSYVAFMGFAGINRLDCPGFEEAAGWRVFEMGTDDICDERSLFDVLF